MNHSRFLDFNGHFHHTEEAIFHVTNRGFRYGDGLFETMSWENGRIQLLNYHTERLRKSMDILKIDGGKLFDSPFIHRKVESLLEKNQLMESECRIRFSVFRDGEGLYTPQTNQA